MNEHQDWLHHDFKDSSRNRDYNNVGNLFDNIFYTYFLMLLIIFFKSREILVIDGIDDQLQAGSDAIDMSEWNVHTIHLNIVK